MATVVGAWGLGLLAGSFLNVCASRWPLGKSVVAPRSSCPRCGALIRWFDNIPLLSFAVLRGHCRTCDGGISWRYPLVELCTATLFALVVARFGTGLEGIKLAVFCSLLLILFVTDLEHLLLPNQVTLTGLATGILISPFVHLGSGLADMLFVLAGIPVPQAASSLAESVLAAVVFGGLLLLIGETYYRLRGVEGLGFGDVKLVAMIAAFTGSGATLAVMVLASLLASAVGSAAVLTGRRTWTDPLPFGSFLAATALVLVFLADTILTTYWRLVLG